MPSLKFWNLTKISFQVFKKKKLNKTICSNANKIYRRSIFLMFSTDYLTISSLNNPFPLFVSFKFSCPASTFLIGLSSLPYVLVFVVLSYRSPLLFYLLKNHLAPSLVEVARIFSRRRKIKKYKSVAFFSNFYSILKSVLLQCIK